MVIQTRPSDESDNDETPSALHRFFFEECGGILSCVINDDLAATERS